MVENIGFENVRLAHRLRIYIDVQLGVFLVLRGWLGYVIRTLISGKYTNARFYKELDTEMLNKRRF